jgi:hypothetical protein
MMCEIIKYRYMLDITQKDWSAKIVDYRKTGGKPLALDMGMNAAAALAA